MLYVVFFTCTFCSSYPLSTRPTGIKAKLVSSFLSYRSSQASTKYFETNYLPSNERKGLKYTLYHFIKSIFPTIYKIIIFFFPNEKKTVSPRPRSEQLLAFIAADERENARAYYRKQLKELESSDKKTKVESISSSTKPKSLEELKSEMLKTHQMRSSKISAFSGIGPNSAVIGAYDSHIGKRSYQSFIKDRESSMPSKTLENIDITGIISPEQITEVLQQAIKEKAKRLSQSSTSAPSLMRQEEIKPQSTLDRPSMEISTTCPQSNSKPNYIKKWQDFYSSAKNSAYLGEEPFSEAADFTDINEEAKKEVPNDVSNIDQPKSIELTPVIFAPTNIEPTPKLSSSNKNNLVGFGLAAGLGLSLAYSSVSPDHKSLPEKLYSDYIHASSNGGNLVSILTSNVITPLRSWSYLPHSSSSSITHLNEPLVEGLQMNKKESLRSSNIKILKEYSNEIQNTKGQIKKSNLISAAQSLDNFYVDIKDIKLLNGPPGTSDSKNIKIQSVVQPISNKALINTENMFQLLTKRLDDTFHVEAQGVKSLETKSSFLSNILELLPDVPSFPLSPSSTVLVENSVHLPTPVTDTFKTSLPDASVSTDTSASLTSTENRGLAVGLAVGAGLGVARSYELPSRSEIRSTQLSEAVHITAKELSLASLFPPSLSTLSTPDVFKKTITAAKNNEKISFLMKFFKSSSSKLFEAAKNLAFESAQNSKLNILAKVEKGMPDVIFFLFLFDVSFVMFILLQSILESVALMKS